MNKIGDAKVLFVPESIYEYIKTAGLSPTLLTDPHALIKALGVSTVARMIASNDLYNVESSKNLFDALAVSLGRYKLLADVALRTNEPDLYLKVTKTVSGLTTTADKETSELIFKANASDESSPHVVVPVIYPIGDNVFAVTPSVVYGHDVAGIEYTTSIALMSTLAARYGVDEVAGTELFKRFISLANAHNGAPLPTVATESIASKVLGGLGSK